MRWRFQRRIKLLPGVWLNVSKSGISTSVGRKGATINFRGGKVRLNAGLRGTGLSCSGQILDLNGSVSHRRTRKLIRLLAWILLSGLGIAAALAAFFVVANLR
ncbi:DUF4236 domain-containing protein [Comamonas sp. JUb58]|uniref:DUF4236 domain-containing protein n=1 Tax=Comamonas sp. JUb58 TaxID=2485114 RepID=UPI00105C7183|nr:DUF4236 domain-containing protein [Comamonas sp. JUb58]